jgi:hypothetical protein
MQKPHAPFKPKHIIKHVLTPQEVKLNFVSKELRMLLMMLYLANIIIVLLRVRTILSVGPDPAEIEKLKRSFMLNIIYLGL